LFGFDDILSNISFFEFFSIFFLAPHAGAGDSFWETVLTTEDAPYAPDPQPPRVDLSGPAPSIAFARPGAVLLRQRPAGGVILKG